MEEIVTEARRYIFITKTIRYIIITEAIRYIIITEAIRKIILKKAIIYLIITEAIRYIIITEAIRYIVMTEGISLSCHEQVCFTRLRFETYFSHHRAVQMIMSRIFKGNMRTWTELPIYQYKDLSIIPFH